MQLKTDSERDLRSLADSHREEYHVCVENDCNVSITPQQIFLLLFNSGPMLKLAELIVLDFNCGVYY